ncbi:AcrB/AcrD/AcrF family protein [Sphingomonas sp.]|uniref:AcrB/AcrD/AcrF family protein n=1 Tax=Sphingomonas sp. TaxID=28214 RepID=UPI00286D0945|nr:AcrB/AcrD/AcrF family protein [Sphingomonas sp.]
MQTGAQGFESRAEALALHMRGVIERHWRGLLLLAWIGLSMVLLWQHWRQVLGFMLGDTDDNMRMSQVRALLAGQDWYDLRNYRMDPPAGANIHWSRIVDLPIAGLILAFRSFVGGADAERIAVAVAPLLPLLPALIGLTLVTRRLVGLAAWPLAIVAVFFAGSMLGMYNPTRIDHHGWQLALLALGIAGTADPKAARGGVTLGLVSAVSLSIGLEMIIYIALGGVAMVLFWVDAADQRRRLLAYAASLSGGCAVGFAAFASYANRLPVCDALSPVWLSDALLAGAFMVGLAIIRVERMTTRLALAAAAGLAIAAFHSLMWPKCLSRLEGVSPEVAQLWLSHVREARPVWTHGWQVASLILALPVSGLIGYILLGWTWREDRAKLRAVIAVAAPALTAGALLFWQTRTGPAAQLLAIPGAVALPWILAPRAFASNNSIVRVLGTSVAVLAGLGALVPLALDFVPDKKATKYERSIGTANGQCPTLAAMKPVALQPKGVVFTFVDLAPRLIAVTHHDSIAGPYHRNGEAIGDVMHAFRGTADEAHAIILKHHADYVLTCPGMSQTTIFMVEAPKGFYGQLTRGQVPKWLEPVALPTDNPMKMYRVVG